MKMNLSEIEVRILGCLIEKELTTPESYPLSINTLTGACNQKSNRAPVMNLAEAEVIKGLEQLANRGLARHTVTGGRVARYRHSLADKGLAPAALAVLAELLLRGPQTAGELRSRGERMTELSDVAAVEEILQSLMDFGPPLVSHLPRRHGQKDQRYAQLFSGEPQLATEEPVASRECARPQSPGIDRLARLDAEMTTLREEISALRCALGCLKAKFE